MGNNVYVTWPDRANATSNQTVMRVSKDNNGKIFGEIIKLSSIRQQDTSLSS